MVGPYVSPDPLPTFRRTTSVGDRLVRSEFRGLTRGDPCNTLGTFPCGSCGYCRYMNTNKHPPLPNGWVFSAKHYANCQTTFVVYLIQCECGCYYVGKTIQKLCKRLYRHILAMKTKNPDFPWVWHMATVHREAFPKISVLVLDRLHHNPRGADLNKLLLQREMRWISTLNATSPPGLNEILSFKPFLQGFTSGGYEGDM